MLSLVITIHGFSLIIELKVTCVDIGYFVGLTPIGNFRSNLGKS